MARGMLPYGSRIVRVLDHVAENRFDESRRRDDQRQSRAALEMPCSDAITASATGLAGRGAVFPSSVA